MQFSQNIYIADIFIMTHITDTSILQTPISISKSPLYDGHLYITDTSILRTPIFISKSPLYYGHLFITDISILQTPTYILF